MREPSDDSYCGGPNEIDVIDPETGEEVTICGCRSCRAYRRKKAKEEEDE